MNFQDWRTIRGEFQNHLENGSAAGTTVGIGNSVKLHITYTDFSSERCLMHSNRTVPERSLDSGDIMITVTMNTVSYEVLS